MATFFDWFRAFNREADVSPAARAVGNAMATRADNQTLRFWITIQEVADFTGISSRHAINKVDELARSSWVERTRRGANGRASEYRLSLPKVNQSAHKEGSEGEQTCTIVPAKVNYSSGKGELWCTPTTPKLPQTTPEKPREDGQAHPLASTPQKSPKQRRSYSPDFERFWSTYPRKIGDKKKAERFFGEQIAEGGVERIIQSAEEFRDECLRIGTEQRYIPYPATWLNQQRWKNVQYRPAHVANPVESKADHFKTMAAAKVQQLSSAKQAQLEGF